MEIIEKHSVHCHCEVEVKQSRCNLVREAETGFCALLFTNFTSDSISFKLDDSIKNYLNTQSIIF